MGENNFTCLPFFQVHLYVTVKIQVIQKAQQLFSFEPWSVSYPGDDFLANFVAHLQNSLNLRLSSQQSSAWVKTTLKNLQYDVEDNCYVAYGGGE